MKIVIVDDEPKIRNGLSRLLSSRPGFEVAGVFDNAAEALEQLSVCHADVIITDIKMPEMDRLEATRIIRKVSQEIPIIALTAFAFDDDRVKALEAGCNDYLTKPLSAPLLKETIAKYLV